MNRIALKIRGFTLRTLIRKNIVSVQPGFTLIELLIVIAIISALAGLFITTFPNAQRRARDTQRRSDIKQYQTSMEAYANLNQGNYPNTSGTVNITSICGTLNLTFCPDDPRGLNPYRTNSGATQFVIWAQLEIPDSSGGTTNFVVCSTGQAGEHTSPTGPGCPL